MATIRTQKEIRQRAPIWLAMLLFGNFALIAVDARDGTTKQRMIRVWAQTIASPFQGASSKAGSASSGFVRNIINFGSAGTENERLKQQVDQLQTDLRVARVKANENESLKGLLGLKEKTGYESVVARVIARDPSLWFNTITIDRGSSSRVELNMPVVTGGGIVGRVIAVSPLTAQVMLITDEKAAAGAVIGQLGQSSALGPVRGLGQSGLIEMRYVSGLEKVELGDYVLTTGQDGIYPPGLNVGEVVDLTRGTPIQTHTIHLRPGARLDQLEEVAVLLYHPPQRPAPDQTLPNVDKVKKQ
jgi:rod shape-determining protein MreC